MRSRLNLSLGCTVAIVCAAALAVPAAAPARTPGLQTVTGRVALDSPVATRSLAPFRTPSPSSTISQFMTQVLINIAGYWSTTARETRGRGPTVRYVWLAPGDRVSTCGTKTKDDAAFYCALDDTIYLSQVLAYQIWTGDAKLGNGLASGDFAVASVLAHEYAHNIQFETGVMRRTYGRTVKPTELQADCMAGRWSRWADARGLLEPGDAEEAAALFAAVGDYGVHEEGHHGTPAQRRDAWLRGYRGGEQAKCAKLLRTR